MYCIELQEAVVCLLQAAAAVCLSLYTLCTTHTSAHTRTSQRAHTPLLLLSTYSKHSPLQRYHYNTYTHTLLLLCESACTRTALCTCLLRVQLLASIQAHGIQAHWCCVHTLRHDACMLAHVTSWCVHSKQCTLLLLRLLLMRLRTCSRRCPQAALVVQPAQPLAPLPVCSCLHAAAPALHL
jgi:hypothetical protein